MNNYKLSVCELLFDGHHGIYIPQMFAQQCNKSAMGEWVWNQELKSDLSLPDNEFYWESWESVLNTAKFVCNDGFTYHLDQLDDVWLVRDGFYMTESGIFNSDDEEVNEDGILISDSHV